ncbi:GNAT family N-acetyltransferase [Hartmannibacter diazotrophicus]|nr:GNAT family N-acetyltransferase [Hartmannibacter diazotrophicus]
MNETELLTPRLRLTALSRGDAFAIADALGNFAVSCWLARVPWPYRLEDAYAFLSQAELATLAGDVRIFAIRAEGEPALIGLVGLQGLREEPEIGYWLAEPHWGKGYASEAVAAVLDHTFSQLGFASVRSGVFLGNDPSLRIQKKLGFEIVGKSLRVCDARGGAQPHIDTRLKVANFRHAMMRKKADAAVEG